MGLRLPPDPCSHAVGVFSMTEQESERNAAKPFRPIVSLRRVWKTYVKDREELLPSGSLSSLSSEGDSTSDNNIPSISLTPPEGDQDLESEDGIKSSSNQDTPELENHRLSVSGVDSETESVVSDYSEMADPVKEHLANVHIVCNSNPNCSSPTQFFVRERVVRGASEGEEEFVRRVRKTNFLSLAQEFADIKRRNEDALPFNLHKNRYREQRESDEDETERGSTHGGIGVPLWDDSERGRDPGYPDEALVEPGSCLDHVKIVGGESRLCCEYPTPVGSNGLLVLKPSELVNFGEGSGCRNREMCSEIAVPASDKSGKSTQAFPAENATNVVRDPPLIAAHGRSDGFDLSAFYVGEPEVIHDRMNNSADGLQKSRISEDFDDCAIERVFPQWDWKGMEDELRERANEEQQEKGLQTGSREDREKILQRLAMLDEEEWCVGSNDQSREPNPLSMGVCYMNEASEDLDQDSWGSSDSPRPDVIPIFDHNAEKADDSNNHFSVDNLLAKQASLEAEARMALAQVRPITRLNSSSDDQMQEKLTMEMRIGTAGSEEKISRHIGLSTLDCMTVAQLQIFVNDLRVQIEVLNLDLMLSLVERDDLHMIQDSMLVDIEDLTGRAREYAAKVDTRRHEKLQVQKCV